MQVRYLSGSRPITQSEVRDSAPGLSDYQSSPGSYTHNSMPVRVPKRVQELEADNPGHRVCYHCDEMKLEDCFSARQRECRGCRSIRYQTQPEVSRAQAILGVARWRAKKRNVPFDLELEDVPIPETCPVLGIKLERGSRTQRDNSPSLDRIIPEKGYTKGNVIVVSWLANNIRRNFSPSDLRKVADFYETILRTE